MADTPRGPGGAIFLEERPWWEKGHEALNAAARKSGATDKDLEHAHRVASGLENLSEACPDCEEQALRYSTGILFEGRRAIVCDNCQATCVDKNEQGGLAMEAAAILQVGRSQGRIKGVVGHG